MIFLCVFLLLQIAANLTDFTYLYIDMILLTSLSITCKYQQCNYFYMVVLLLFLFSSLFVSRRTGKDLKSGY